MKVNETVKLLESGGARTLMAQLYGEDGVGLKASVLIIIVKINKNEIIFLELNLKFIFLISFLFVIFRVKKIENIEPPLSILFKLKCKTKMYLS